LAIKPRPTERDLPIVKILEVVDPELNKPCATSVVVVNGVVEAKEENYSKKERIVYVCKFR